MFISSDQRVCNYLLERKFHERRGCLIHWCAQPLVQCFKNVLNQQMTSLYPFLFHFSLKNLKNSLQRYNVTCNSLQFWGAFFLNKCITLWKCIMCKITVSLEPSWLRTGCLTIGTHETYSHQKSDLQIRCKTAWRHTDIHWVTLYPLENKANYKRWILTSISPPPFIPASVKTSSLKCVNHLYLESPGAAYQKNEEPCENVADHYAIF